AAAEPRSGGAAEDGSRGDGVFGSIWNFFDKRQPDAAERVHSGWDRHQRWAAADGGDYAQYRRSGRDAGGEQHAESGVLAQLGRDCERDDQERHESFSWNRVRVLPRYFPQQRELLFADAPTLSPERVWRNPGRAGAEGQTFLLPRVPGLPQCHGDYRFHQHVQSGGTGGLLYRNYG